MKFLILMRIIKNDSRGIMKNSSIKVDEFVIRKSLVLVTGGCSSHLSIAINLLNDSNSLFFFRSVVHHHERLKRSHRNWQEIKDAKQ